MQANHKLLTCPKCGQRLRIPTNLGNLAVNCPSCRFGWDWFVTCSSASNVSTSESHDEPAPLGCDLGSWDAIEVQCQFCKLPLTVVVTGQSLRIACYPCRIAWEWPEPSRPAKTPQPMHVQEVQPPDKTGTASGEPECSVKKPQPPHVHAVPTPATSGTTTVQPQNRHAEAITTNVELARAYFNCVSKCASDWRTYLKIKKAIAQSQLDLRTHFDKYGSLQTCKVPGVGRKTFDLLERILLEGSVSVRTRIMEERENALKSKPGEPSLANPIADDADDDSSTGALDNAIRVMEQDRD